MLAFNRVMAYIAMISLSIILAACGGGDETRDKAREVTQVIAQSESGKSTTRKRALDAAPSEVASVPEYVTFPEEVITWGEYTYPDLFKGQFQEFRNLNYGGALYSYGRLYSDTGNAVAVRSDGAVMGIGPYTSGTLTTFSPDFKSFAEAVKRDGYLRNRNTFVHVKYADTGADPFPVAETIARVNVFAKEYQSWSYGKAIQLNDVKPVWITLPETRAYYQSRDPTGKSLSLEVMLLVEKLYGLQNIGTIVAVIPPLENGLPGCYAARLALWRSDSTVRLPVVMLSMYASRGVDDCRNTNLMAHEIMHTQGLPNLAFALSPLHSSDFSCKSWIYGIPVNFTDPTWNDTDCGEVPGDFSAAFLPYGYWDVLGSYRGHPNAFWKSYMGWLTQRQIAVATSDTRITIAPYEKTTSGVQALKVPLGFDQKGKPVAYWFQYLMESPKDLETGETLDIGLGDRLKVWLNLESVPSNLVDGGRSRIDESRVFSFQFGSGAGSVHIRRGGCFREVYRGFQVCRGENEGENATVTVTFSKLKVEPLIGHELHPGEAKDVTITNTGETPVRLSEFKLDGREPTLFRITQNSCSNAPLPQGGQCTVRVEYLQTVDRAIHAAHLTATTDDPFLRVVVVGLNGSP